MEKTSKFWDDLSSHKEQNKGNSRIIHSFVGLIYPNLIEEHCKFTVTENVLISVSVEPSFRGNPLEPGKCFLERDWIGVC